MEPRQDPRIGASEFCQKSRGNVPSASDIQSLQDTKLKQEGNNEEPGRRGLERLLGTLERMCQLVKLVVLQQIRDVASIGTEFLP